MAAKKPASSPKSDFIRQQPSSMSIPEVVAAGKKAGLTFSRALVHIVRGKMASKGRPGASKAVPTKKATTPKTAVSKKTPMTKADFVRANPSLSPKQIVAKAVADGMTFTENYVSNVRTYDKAVAARKKATTATKAATTKTPAQPPTALSKADFVRQFPHLSPQELVKQAKADGIKLTDSYVHDVRRYDKERAAKKRVAKKVAVQPATTTAVVKPVTVAKPVIAPKPAAVSESAVRSSAIGDARIEDILKAAASALGFGRAMDVIREEQARLMAVLGA